MEKQWLRRVNKSLTPERRNFNFGLNKYMAENIPSLPGGAVPPQPPEGSKVQPKKETVRINLPPKPSAAPTIKLPTLPPGGPSSAPGAAPFPPPAAAPAAAAPRATAAAPASAAAAPAQRPAPRAVAAPAAPAISAIDKVLAIVAAVAGLAAVGTTVYCMMLFK
jgi:hypothetical protein